MKAIKDELRRKTIAADLIKAIAAGDYRSYFKVAWDNYGLVAKNPDTPYSFCSYIRTIEMASMELLGGNHNKLTTNFKQDCRFQRIRDAIIAKGYEKVFYQAGNTTLANTEILLSALKASSADKRAKSLLIFADTVNDDRLKSQARFASIDILGLGHLDLDERRLTAIALIEEIESIKEVHFWSIPIDLPFISAGIRRADSKVRITFTTTKYGYAFSRSFVDCMVSSPGLFHYPREDCTRVSYYYGFNIQNTNRGTIEDQKLSDLQVEINRYRNDGFIAITSFARPEKLVNDSYAKVMRFTSRVRDRVVYLLFGHDADGTARKWIESFGVTVVYCGFQKLYEYTDYIDIYIDPVPHGGGYSLNLATHSKLTAIIPYYMGMGHGLPSGVNLLMGQEPSSMSRPANDLQEEIGEEHMKLIFPESDDELLSSIISLVQSKSLRDECSKSSEFIARYFKKLDCQEYADLLLFSEWDEAGYSREQDCST